MIEKINSMIREKKFTEAYAELQTLMKKSYDFSNQSDRSEYNQLMEMKDRFESDFFSDAIIRFEKEVKTRSHSIVIKVDEDKVKITDPPSFIKAFNQVHVNLKSKHTLPELDSIIIIANNKDAVGEYVNDANASFYSQFNQIKSGEWIEFESKEKIKVYFLYIAQDINEIDLNEIMLSFCRLVNSVYEEFLERAGILFEIKNSASFNSIKKVFYYNLIFNLVFLITKFNTSGNQPEFTFLFEEDRAKKTFEDVIIRLNSVNSRPLESSFRNKEEILNALKQRALTNDKVYIEQLSSLCNVIDEDDVSILIKGETGVGKSFLARSIHNLSIRSHYPYEEQNCAAFNVNSPDKLTQKLLGWKKGAFTGAYNDYDGKIKRAKGGTLFLDEIDKASIEARNELLIFIDTKQYEVLGDLKNSDADVRLIFGTNKDLKSLIRKDKFEEDFYYRIMDRSLIIPPLRQRKDDIEIIVNYFINDLNSKNNVLISLENNVIDKLQTYDWTGNVRMLRQYIKHIYYDCKSLSKEKITAELLKKYPPEDTVMPKEEELEELIDLLKKFLAGWENDKGSFIDEVTSPILAKLYLDECYLGMSKTDKMDKANKLLGISGKHFNKSTLQAAYEKYPEVKHKLGL